MTDVSGKTHASHGIHKNRRQTNRSAPFFFTSSALETSSHFVRLLDIFWTKSDGAEKEEIGKLTEAALATSGKSTQLDPTRLRILSWSGGGEGGQLDALRNLHVESSC